MASADLSVTKAASPVEAGVGQVLTYTVTARNNGPDQATLVELTDSIPTGVSILSITAPAAHANYCYYNGNITWYVGTLDVGEEAELTVEVIPQEAGTLANVATIYSTNEEEEDPVPENNTFSLEVEVTPSADLLIVKDSCPAETILGNTVTYLITVINNGPSTAENVVVTDTLPAGVSVESIEPGSGSQSGNTVTWDLGSMDPNERADLKITVTPGSEGEITDFAEVTSDTPDPNPENNQDSIKTNILPAADIAVSKSVSSEQVVPGQIFTYTIIVENNGPSNASGVTVFDNLPDNVTVDSISQSQGTYTHAGNAYTFNLGGLASDATATIEINVRATEEGMICNTADASATEADPDECNNSSEVCAFARRIAGTDLSVTKTHDPEPAGLCSPVLYTITVTNNGPIVAAGVTLVDQLPPALEPLSVNSSQGSCCICEGGGCGKHKHHRHKKCGLYKVKCNKHFHHEECEQDHCHEHSHEDYCREDCCHEDGCRGSTQVVCQLGALAVGASAVVEVLARPKMLGTIQNTAIVTSNEEDLEPANNQATDLLNVITITEQIDILIARVNELIISGDIPENYGQILISYLEDAKISLCAHNTQGAECDIRNFINKVRMYIEKNIITKEIGCELIKSAELIEEALECLHTCHKDKCGK